MEMAKQDAAADTRLYINNGGRYSAEATQCFERYYIFRNMHASGKRGPNLAAAMDKAKQCLKQLVNHNEHHPLVLYKYANVLRHDNQCNKALGIFKQAEGQLRATYPTHDHTKNLNAVIANCSLGTAGVEEGIARYRAAVSADPQDVNARLNLANRLMRDDQYEAAWSELSIVEKGLNTNQLHLSQHGIAVLREYQGWVKMFGWKDYRTAAQYFEAAAKLSPNRPTVIEGLAWSYEAPSNRNRQKSDAAWYKLINLYKQDESILNSVMTPTTAKRLKMIKR